MQPATPSAGYLLPEEEPVDQRGGGGGAGRGDSVWRGGSVPRIGDRWVGAGLLCRLHTAWDAGPSVHEVHSKPTTIFLIVLYRAHVHLLL